MHKKDKETTPSFVLTLSLHYEPWQRKVLDTTFSVAQKMSNLLIEDRLKALRQMERTREWRSLTATIADSYKEIERLTKEQTSIDEKLNALSEERTKDARAKKHELRARQKELKSLIAEKKRYQKDLFQCRDDILARYGMSEYSFQERMKKYRNHYKCINSMIAQKLASRVWTKFYAYLFSNGDDILFIPWADFRSIEGKSNDTGIRFLNGVVFIRKMKIPIQRGRTEYELEALKSRIKYCRIIRIPWKDGWLYRLQLTLEGYPPDKGRILGKGRVGIDPGTQTIAVVSNTEAMLRELADKANMVNAELRRINRAMDRSRRATNPMFFNEDGTIIRKDKLPEELLVNGKRKWIYSNRYKRLAMKRRYLYAKLARVRIVQHNTMANQLLALGSEFYVETMRYSALAKKAKYEPPKDGEKNKRRKRFGKSVANKAPASFLNILEKKVLAHGGEFHRINTAAAKASQYNHLSHKYKPKKLSERWADLGNGIKVQRDLYSAFLIQNTNKTLDGFNKSVVTKKFDDFKVLHDKEIARLQSLDKSMPTSMGIRKAG